MSYLYKNDNTSHSYTFYYVPNINCVRFEVLYPNALEHLQKYGRISLYGRPDTIIVKQCNLITLFVSYDQAEAIATYLTSINRHKYPLSTFNLDDHPELLI